MPSDTKYKQQSHCWTNAIALCMGQVKFQMLKVDISSTRRLVKEEYLVIILVSSTRRPVKEEYLVIILG